MFARMVVGKFGGERVDGLRSFSVEIVEMGFVGTANVVTNRGKARQMVEARDSIGGPNAASKVETNKEKRMQQQIACVVARQIDVRKYFCR